MLFQEPLVQDKKCPSEELTCVAVLEYTNLQALRVELLIQQYISHVHIFKVFPNDI